MKFAPLAAAKLNGDNNNYTLSINYTNVKDYLIRKNQLFHVKINHIILFVLSILV